MNKEIINFDIVVLGAGLAGMRAAYSALLEAPELKIGVISVYEGPSGSSFCNLNRRLGMLVPSNDRERKIFVDRAREIASPGLVNDTLLHVQAEEAEKRFLDLVELGVRFEKDKNNRLEKYPACFLPDPKCAIIIQDVKNCFFLWLRKLRGHVKFLFNYVVLDLLVYDKDIAGVLLFDVSRDRYIFVRAKCVICALGGAASLFPWTLVSYNPFGGYVLSLLERAGVSLINHRFIQMLWVRKKDYSFFSIEEFFKRTNLTIENNLLKERRSHCPIAYSLRDFVLDRFLFDNLTSQGVLIENRKKSFYVIPAAQVSHGGVVIDEKSMTDISGLFACGECAAGMHGANRVGGAMVLSTQVFGHRAGKFAARLSKGKDFLSDRLFTNLINENRIEESLGIGIYEEEIRKLNISESIVKAVLLSDKRARKRVRLILDRIIKGGSKYFVLSRKVESLKLIIDKGS